MIVGRKEKMEIYITRYDDDDDDKEKFKNLKPNFVLKD